jgi:hypothetical protein
MSGTVPDKGTPPHPGDVPAADRRLAELVAIIGRLAAVIERERTSFAARRPRELEGLLPEKEALADLYAKEMRFLAKERAWIEAASPPARHRLHAAVQDLRAQLADYLRAILARRTVVEGLVRALGQEVARQRQPFTAYGGAGSASARGRSAIAFDQTA